MGCGHEVGHLVGSAFCQRRLCTRATGDWPTLCAAGALGATGTASRDRLKRRRDPRRGDVFQVIALTDVHLEHSLDLHRDVLYRQRYARRYSLCTTPCRLVINQPLLLSVEGIDVLIAPEAQRQSWVIIPERHELRVTARVLAAAGFISALIGLVYFRAGANARIDPLGSSLDPDASFRGGVAGLILGSSLFIAGTTAARLFRGRATQVY